MGHHHQPDLPPVLQKLSSRDTKAPLGLKGPFEDPQPAADALRRARKLPIGHDRSDLRQLAVGLLWLERKGLKPADRVATILALEELRS